MSLQRLEDNAAVWAWRGALQADGAASLHCVPTMGALHRGHVRLIEAARAAADAAQPRGRVVVSLFVNPTQFNDPGDAATYPQPLDADLALCEEAGVDAVWLPRREHLYPDDYAFRITHAGELSGALEGASRPGHFTGVLTVVTKLFALLRPDVAYFGEKDFQQLQLVRGLCEALLLGVRIVACPTVRAADGLALSSRNTRLSEQGRRRAAAFPRILRQSPTPGAARAALEAEGFGVEYIEERWGRRLGAVQLEGVRLIDNLPLEEVGR